MPFHICMRNRLFITELEIHFRLFVRIYRIRSNLWLHFETKRLFWLYFPILCLYSPIAGCIFPISLILAAFCTKTATLAVFYHTLLLLADSWLYFPYIVNFGCVLHQNGCFDCIFHTLLLLADSWLYFPYIVTFGCILHQNDYFGCIFYVSFILATFCTSGLQFSLKS